LTIGEPKHKKVMRKKKAGGDSVRKRQELLSMTSSVKRKMRDVPALSSISAGGMAAGYVRGRLFPGKVSFG